MISLPTIVFVCALALLKIWYYLACDCVSHYKAKDTSDDSWYFYYAQNTTTYSSTHYIWSSYLTPENPMACVSFCVDRYSGWSMLLRTYCYLWLANVVWETGLLPLFLVGVCMGLIKCCMVVCQVLVVVCQGLTEVIRGVQAV